MTESSNDPAAMPVTTTESVPVAEAGVASTAAPAEVEHGWLYWFTRNVFTSTKNFAKRHWLIFTIVAVTLVLGLYIDRGYIHEYVIAARKYFAGVIVGIGSVIALIWWFKRSGFKIRIITILLLAVAAWPTYHYARPIHDYFSLYLRFHSLDIVKLSDLPETAYERIQPLNSVFTMASGQISNNNTPTEPHFVLIGGNYRFTMAAEPPIEPTYLFKRLFGSIKEVYEVPGTQPNIDLSKPEAKSPVSFPVGENLYFGHNIYTAVRRSFGLWRYLNYEPDSVVYVKNDNNQWVQVVTLIRWKGLFFSWPEFGGVQVIEQAPNTVINSCIRAFIGVGHYVSPKELESGKYPFLKGQNVRSYKVSRFMAESFKFIEGFRAPLPLFHNGDIRIADMPEDCNDQPFVIYEKMSTVVPGATDALYHSFVLEPFNKASKGSVVILFIPADGSGKVYASINEENKLNLVGISSVPQLVINDHPFFDWSSHAPVETRLYIRIIDGVKYYYGLTTVVTKNEKDNKLFIGGNNPNVALTDLKSRRVFWMRPPESATFVSQLREQMKLPAGSPMLPPLPGAAGPPTTPAPSIVPPAIVPVAAN